jgi:hypothetical protein
VIIYTLYRKKQGKKYYSTLGTPLIAPFGGVTEMGSVPILEKKNMFVEQTYTKRCTIFLQVYYQTRALICRININDNLIDQERRFRYVS